MPKKTLSEKMQPVLQRPGMYVGPSPINLLWYLSGMFDLEGVFSGNSNWNGDSLISRLADKLMINEVERTEVLYSAVEARLLQGDPKARMALICDVARALLVNFERNAPL